MKELAVYFKKRMKEQDTIPRLYVDRNYGEEIEYNIDNEIESRRIKLMTYLWIDQKKRNIILMILFIM
jgi:hypothetical protein